MNHSLLAGLRGRLLVLFLLAVIPALGLLVYGAYDQQAQAMAAMRVDAVRLARLASAGEQEMIESARQLLATMSRLPAVREGNTAVCQALLPVLLNEHPRYTNLGVANPEGDIYCSAVSASGLVNVSDRAHFQRALETHSYAIGDYQVGRITGKATFILAYPVLDDSGQPQGVVLAALNLDWLNHLAATADLPAGSSLTVIDRKGTILARYPDPETWVGQSLAPTEVGRSILAQGEGVMEAVGIDGVQRLFAFTPLRNQMQSNDVDAYVAIGIPMEVAYGEFNRTLARNLGGLGVAMLALLLAGLGSHALVLQPFNALLSATRQLAAGDFTARTRLNYGLGELNQLARAFNTMAETIQQREARLDEARAQYRTLVEQVPAVTYVALLDENRTVLYVSPQIEHILGYSASEWVGNAELWSRCLHRDDRERVLAELAHSQATGESFSSEYRLQGRGGSAVWVRDVARLVCGDPQKPLLAQGVMLDITQQKVMEEALRQSEERFRAIFERAAIGISLADSQGRWVEVNPALGAMLGYSAEELRGREFSAFTHSGDVPANLELFGEMMAGRRDRYQLEKRYVHRDGRTIWANLTCSAVRTSAGDRRFSIAMVEDITEQKLAEEALRRSEERYRTLVESVDDAIHVKDASGRFVMLNSELARRFERPAAEIIGKTAAEVFPARVARQVEEEDRRVLEAGEVVDTELEVTAPGQRRVVHQRKIPLRNEAGEIVGLVGIGRDVTERKRIEEQLLRAERLEMAGRIAGQVAHDFNNLLSPMLTFPELIRERLPAGDPDVKLCDDLLDAARQMLTITEDLLALGRRGSFGRSPVDLNRLVEQVVARMPAVPETLTLQMEMGSDLRLIEGSPAQLARVIANLLDNAREAMLDRGVLSVHTANASIDRQMGHRNGQKKGEFVRLVVRDTGCGIAPEIREKIFEPYFTTKVADRRRGSGLGLSVVQAILEDHQASVDLQSEVGKGASFTIYFPVPQVARPETETGVEGTAAPDSPPKEVQRPAASLKA